MLDIYIDIKNKNIFIEIQKLVRFINNDYHVALRLEYNNTFYYNSSSHVIFMYDKYCNSGYRYVKDYCIIKDIRSYINRSKHNSQKNIYLYSILYKYYHILYIYFIYTKYYTIFNGKKDYLFLIDIYSKKLFNCRDHYMFFNYIGSNNALFAPVYRRELCIICARIGSNYALLAPV